MTVFPGVKVRSIDTAESVTGRDPGLALEPSEELAAAGDIIPEEIQSLFVKSDMDKLLYDLRIESVSKRAAVAKGKAFVRFKNPFEPTNIRVTGPVVKTDDSGPRDTYQVSLGITKA